ncbi:MULTISPECIES: signal peptidase I [Novosphingobium]|uniref:Signal peptidase I n=1 Tax=Novosphingobium mathurense TaxID=428990 RepID=A0A1U6H3Q3_9SPHN|nr:MULTISPECIES: signal peptidase I [Novosphingobium]CDO38013.1 Signal peptidase I (SPase I) (Leader peptidase I) [Novosphingobium sp. KN65.2]SLJ90411.1 signal peptidase I Serine peptidase. MEROPS family S26A [Novosphingobium mathurense]
MSETNSDAAKPAIDSTAKKPAAAEKKDEGFFSFLFWLVLAVVVLRSFIISPFNIPSESMLPRLLTGDYLFATKWSYGYSKYSLPFSLPLIPGRIFASQPERGDVVIFKAPPGNDVDYIKRVIGLPGDEIQIRSGQVFINGKAVPKQRLDDFILPVSPNTDCYAPEFETTDKDGKPVCHYPQFRETLPNGKSYNVLDLGTTPQDDTGVYIVPEDHLFLMGDNRDNSMDSRFPAVEGQGIGIVPQGNLVGKAAIMMFSTDGSAEWIKPWTWFTAARWSRIGGTF